MSIIDQLLALSEQGVKFQVHFNLQTFTWTITCTKTVLGIKAGNVIANVTKNIALRDVEFIVSEAGRDRSERLGKRTVHARVRGYIVAVDADLDLSERERVTYNPAPDKPRTFVKASDGEPVFHADYAEFSTAPDNPKKGYGWI